MRTKRQEAAGFIMKIARRAVAELAFENSADANELRRLSHTLISKMVGELYDDYVWLELCDIMSWKRRRVLNPPVDHKE